MRNSSPLHFLCALLLVCSTGALAGCDSNVTNLVNDDGGSHDGGDVVDGGFSDGRTRPDADPLAPDASPPAGCVPGTTQCTDCKDNDGDGLFDGFDPGCTSAADNIEGSFATGISGDNIDPKTQDCFFDGNSGGGDDKCAYHTCCLTDVNHDGTCPIGPPHYDPSECTVTQQCIDNCAPAATGGCDCFGCCTICNGSDCKDIAVNPAISPNCTQDTYNDPSKCLPCNKSNDCTGTPCGPGTCTLCPGQLPEDLPPECNNTTTCPGSTACTATSGCTGTDFCASGCCVHQIG